MFGLTLELLQLLQSEDSTLQLAVFDAWRPIAVQRFMVDHVINEQCQRSGINPEDKNHIIIFCRIFS